MTTAAFERFVYAWSEHGLEGTARYQVTAASPRIRQAFLKSGALLSLATRLGYWAPARDDESTRVFGWQWTQMGLFVFSKHRVPAGHWAATGGFVCHGYHTIDPVGLRVVCALGSDELIENADEAAARGDLLDPLPARLPTTMATGAGQQVAELMSAALMSEGVSTQRGFALPVSSSEMYDGLLMCAERLPLPQFTRCSVSTSETAEHSAGYGLVGIGPNSEPSRYPNMRLLSAASIEPGAVNTARLAFAEPARARAALGVATSKTEMDTNLFSAILTVLTADSAQLTTKQAVSVLSHPDAADMALELAQVRARAIELSLTNWEVLGKRLSTAFVGHRNEADGAGEMARGVLQVGFPLEMWSTLGEANLRLRALVAQQLAATATGLESGLQQAPSEWLVAVLQVIARGQPVAATRARLRLSLLSTLSHRFFGNEALRSLPPIDVATLAAMLWELERWRQFESTLDQLNAHQQQSLSEMLGTENGRQLFARWVKSTDRAELGRYVAPFLGNAAAGMALSASLVWAMTWLSHLLPGQEFVSALSAKTQTIRAVGEPSAEHLRALGDLAAAGVQQVLLQRTADGERAQLTFTEREMTRFLSSSQGCDQLYNAASLCLQLNAKSVTANQFAELLNQAGHGAPSRASVLVLLDGVLGVCEDPHELALIVEQAASSLGVSRAEVWTSAFNTFDCVMRVRSTRVARTRRHDLIAEAVKEGARRRHFGALMSASTLLGDGLPRELRERMDKWRY